MQQVEFRHVFRQSDQAISKARLDSLLHKCPWLSWGNSSFGSAVWAMSEQAAWLHERVSPDGSTPGFYRQRFTSAKAFDYGNEPGGLCLDGRSYVWQVHVFWSFRPCEELVSRYNNGQGIHLCIKKGGEGETGSLFGDNRNWNVVGITVALLPRFAMFVYRWCGWHV